MSAKKKLRQNKEIRKSKAQIPATPASAAAESPAPESPDAEAVAAFSASLAPDAPGHDAVSRQFNKESRHVSVVAGDGGKPEKEQASPKKSYPGRVETPRRGLSPAAFVIGILAALAIGVYGGTLYSGSVNPSHSVQSAASGREVEPALSTDEQAHILKLEQAVLKDPNDLASWIHLGNVYFDASKPREAVRAYERALAIKPDNPDVLTDLGIMYRETGQYERAVDAFKKSIAIRPGHQNAMFNAGVVLFFDLGRKDEARQMWRALLAVNPNAKAPDGQPVSEMLSKLQ